MARACRAGADASGDAVHLGNVLVIDAVDAERALLHHASLGVELARAIGAGPGAEAAAHAGILVDQHDAICGALVAGACRADGDAGRVVAVQARFGEMDDLRRAVRRLDLELVDAVQPGAGGLGAVCVLVAQRRAIAAGVPFLAADRAGMAADADIEVDDEAELALGRLRQCRHPLPPRPDPGLPDFGLPQFTRVHLCSRQSSIPSTQPSTTIVPSPTGRMREL